MAGKGTSGLKSEQERRNIDMDTINFTPSNDINKWTEVTKNLFREVVASGVCYEIVITHKDKDGDINKAQAMLFIAGDWKKDNTYFFEREILLNDTVEKCLIKAIEDYKHMEHD